MPLWDHQCNNCSDLTSHQPMVFEDICPWEAPNSTCPICGSNNTQRLFTPATKPYNPYFNNLFAKGNMLRDKYLGKIPYRKSSESQSD